MTNNNQGIITTNIIVDKVEIDYNQLDAKYKLVRFQIPEQFRFKAKNDKNAHFYLHSEYKEFFENPYYFYSHDKYNQKEYSEFALYALFSKEEEIKPLQFTFLDNEAKYQIIDLKDSKLKLHVLLKVLLANYFYNQSEKARRICQSKFYIIGRETTKYMTTCVNIENRHYKTTDEIEEFNIIPSAVDFVKKDQKDIKEHYPKYYEYFEKTVKEGLEYMRQLKPSEVKAFDGQIFQLRNTSVKNRANLEWHTDNESKQKNTRGYVTYKFQKKYVEYLQDLLGEKSVKRKVLTTAKEFKPKIKKAQVKGIGETGLPIKMLEKVYVYDNRLQNPDKKETFSKIRKKSYIELLSQYSKEQDYNINFVSVNYNDISNPNFRKPVLIIQDVVGSEFNFENDQEAKNKSIGGFLGEQGFEDPYKILYQKFNHFPKQSLNVNTVTPFNRNGKARFNENNYSEYFNYPLFDYNEDKLFEYKLAICLNELLFKHFIINNIPVFDFNNSTNRLPWLSSDKGMKYLFMHDQTLMYIDNKKMQFADLAKKEGKLKRKELLEQNNIDWYKLKDEFEAKYYLNGKEESKKETKWKNARFIFSENLALEIEEPIEKILFNFDKGDKIRKREGTADGIVGVWYEPMEKIYTVGSSTSPKFGQMSRANRIRKFYTYQDDNEFTMNDFFETLTVGFVRNKQYTVYPFPFDLIKLYNEIKK